MTTFNTNPVVYNVAPVDMPEGLPVVPSEVNSFENEPNAPKKKNVLARLFCAILAALSVAVFFLPIVILTNAKILSASIFSQISELLGSEIKLFGILPALMDSSYAPGQLATMSLYGFALAMVLTFVCGFIGIFCSKKAPAMLRTTVCFFTLGFAIYTVTTLAVVYFYINKMVIDLICIAGTAIGFLLCLILCVAKFGKKGWSSFVQLFLSFVVSVALILATIKTFIELRQSVHAIGLNGMENKVALALFVLATLNLFLALISVQTRDVPVDIVRFIIVLLLGAGICYLAIASKSEEKLFLILAIVVAAVSLVQLIIAIVQCKLAKPREEKEEVEFVEKAQEKQVAVKEEVPSEFIREEFAEALPYEGGPVDGVEVAKEVNPTFVAPPTEVKTAGYDFYNCKSFDPFIAILDNEERNQFTELFILKYKGTMPEIPDYQVGGDNKEFFRKVFIYLGQYRDRIPNGLLAKIYQFAIKM